MNTVQQQAWVEPVTLTPSSRQDKLNDLSLEQKEHKVKLGKIYRLVMDRDTDESTIRWLGRKPMQKEGVMIKKKEAWRTDKKKSKYSNFSSAM